ncbi:MAG: PAS domain S-box protein [Bacteroidota bacterium]|jgi:PAS domain S-box-containing protein
MKSQQPKQTTPWFLISVFLLLVISILIAGIRFYQVQQTRIKSEAQNYLAAIADLKVSQIAQWRHERIADGELLLHNLPFLRTVEAFLKSSFKIDRKQELLAVMKSFQIKAGYESSILFDVKGKVRLSVSSYGDSVGTRAQLLFQEVLRSRKVILSDLHKSGPFPIVHMDLIVPLFSPDRPDSALIGVFMLRIDPQVIFFPLIQTWPTPSRTSETLLLEQDGDSIVYLNELRHKKNTMLTLRLPISNEQLPASMAVRGIKGVVEGIDYRGVPVLAAIRPVPDSPWYMNAKVDQEEIYAPLRSQAWIAVIGMFLFLLSASGFVGVWWRHQREKFYRDKYLAEVERQALLKHFDYIVKYANDSILLIDMNGKIVEVNDQACRMYGYTREELCHLYIRDLRSQQTRSQIEKQMKQVEDRSGLVFETEHQRKDGTVFPAEVSSRFIKIEETKYYQSTIRDITERKQAEETLRESEEKYRCLSENSLEGIGLSKENQIIYANKALLEIFGYNDFEEFRAKPLLYHVAPESQVKIREMLKNAKEGKSYEKRFSYKIIRRDGEIRDLEITTDHVKIGNDLYTQSTFRDITERKIAEDALLQSEDRFRRIFEEGPLGMVTSGSDFKFIKANTAFCKMMGYEEKELTAFTFKDITHPEYITKDTESINKLLAGDIPFYRTEKRYIRKDQRVVWGAATITVIYDKNKQFSYFLVMIEDITERKQAEEALLQSEGLFKTLVESSPVSIAVFSGQKQNIQYVSHRFSELFGYEQADLQSLSAWWTIAYPMEEYRNQIEAAWRTSVEWSQRENREPEPIESVITCKDGSTKYIESTFTSMSDHTLVFFSDLTQRRMAEEALRQTHAFNDLLIQTMPFGMNIVDEEGTILFINKTMKEMLTVDAIDMCCWNVYKDDNLQCQNCPLKRGISFGKPDVFETTGVLGGKTFQISHVGMMYEGHKAMLEVFQDITEQKKLQQELMQNQKMLSIGTLAGGIAHDFNNILGIILGYISILPSMKDNQQKFSDGVSAIKQAVDRGAGLVRQILTFARKTEIAFEPLDVPDLTQELVSMLQQTFPKIITFNKEIETQLPMINADHAQIHQILLNLCVNARDAMPNGGVITIKAHIAAGDKLRERFTTANEQFYICITVSDTGTGMDETTLNRIFDPFFTTKEKGKGTGLGLSVVYGVVQAHHGFVDVESAVESGTTFQIYLPVPKESITALEAGKAGLVPGGTEMLLIVEDEDLLLDMVQILLEAHGYTVLTAKDGMEAVNVYNQHAHEIALVISDMGLPKLSGDGEFKKLKEINPAVKMILASGYFEPNMKATLENAGACGFLQKPYIIEDVLGIIRKTLDGK